MLYSIAQHRLRSPTLNNHLKTPKIVILLRYSVYVYQKYNRTIVLIKYYLYIVHTYINRNLNNERHPWIKKYTTYIHIGVVARDIGVCNSGC